MEKDKQLQDEDDLRAEYELSQLEGDVRGKYLEDSPRRASGIGYVPPSITALAIVLLLGMLSWITVLPGTPRVWAPFNLLVLAPAFLLDEYFSSAKLCSILAAFVVPLFFLLWTFPATWQSPKPPMRTILLSLVTIALSACSLVFGYSWGMEYHGANYVHGVAIISVICWTTTLALAVLASRKRNATWNFAFHVSFFAWLAWYAIPCLGELP